MAGKPSGSGSWLSSNRASVELVGFCLLVTFVAVFVAIRARARLNELAISRMQAENVATSIDRWETRFQPVSPAERADWARFESASARFAAGNGGRFFLIQAVTRLAEGAGLANVRVRAGADSSARRAPEAQGGTAAEADATDYQVRVTFSGSFAAADRFVSSLPDVASPLQLNASRQDGSGMFTLVLSIHEVKPVNGSG